MPTSPQMGEGPLRLSPSQTLRVVASTPKVLEVESTWTTGKPPPRHWHPAQDERFEVIEGELTVELGTERPQVVAAGGVIEVPARTAHRMWNAEEAPVTASWRVTPAMGTEELFRFIDGGLNAIRIAWMLWTFRGEYRLGSPRGAP
jgi:quercetin dioxygenase-like cupin family protein